MALVINRTLSDGGNGACFEVVGDTGGESDTIVDVSSLSGATGDGDERVMVTMVMAMVCDTDGSGGAVTLSWDGSGDNFLTLPVGTTSLRMTWTPTNDSTGDILISATDNTVFTLRLFVDKIAGFANSTARAGGF